ncbi:hypothetical protein SAMN04488030_2100 [Aliiroseovarius halocynthiae]|uniref:Cation/multidrug efflux pump n=1 Tax=Aliiroseovarius halocynthiae TaxID=985055 RepID=A0A545SRM4_9RHOB|nr:hypothetical protein [Aliiroseovarius halocynthiae]TQV67609.1 hypothetical protein FIL88_10365 [Aliiroseovarius halocynthiae]SMR81630.1 hypothetical protein SAMN04488030_2100 [Aliiroseovarius halocynthiae]
MVAALRLIVFGFIGLSIVYVLVSLYSRSVRLEKLEEKWLEDHPDGNESDREAWLREGMADYQKSFRPKLILLVYVVPALLVLLSIILIN